MNYEFTDEYTILSQFVEPGLKCWFSNGWFTVVSKEIKEVNEDKFVRLKVVANFKGKATLDLPLNYELTVEKSTALGHKFRHLWTNDSSQAIRKK
jgi:hypothetical protein